MPSRFLRDSNGIPTDIEHPSTPPELLRSELQKKLRAAHQRAIRTREAEAHARLCTDPWLEGSDDELILLALYELEKKEIRGRKAAELEIATALLQDLEESEAEVEELERAAIDSYDTRNPIVVPTPQYDGWHRGCLLYTSPSPRDGLLSRMPSSA